jgi:hypothetical protein
MERFTVYRHVNHFYPDMKAECRFEFLLRISKMHGVSVQKTKILTRDMRHTSTSVAAEITGLL